MSTCSIDRRAYDVFYCCYVLLAYVGSQLDRRKERRKKEAHRSNLYEKRERESE